MAFDTKDERIISIGDDGKIGVGAAEEARKALRETLERVLDQDYEPSNIVTSAASTKSFDQLAAEDPERAELAAVREAVEETAGMVRSIIASGDTSPTKDDFRSLTRFVASFFQEPPARFALPEDLEKLITDTTSGRFDNWVRRLMEKVGDGWLYVSFGQTEEYGPDEAPF